MCRGRRLVAGLALALVAGSAAGCSSSSSTPPGAQIAKGVVFTFPVDGQLDVPVGARLLVSFSAPVDPSALSTVTVAGPSGPVAITASVIGNGNTLAITSSALAPATTYQVTVPPAVCPQGEKLSATAPLFAFTTRNDRPLAGPPTVIAIDGSPPDRPASFRPILTTSTLELVFSEPLDPRSVVAAPGGIELLDTTTQAPVAFTLLSNGIHVALDPAQPLAAGDDFELRLGANLVDLGGEALAPVAIAIHPQDGRGAAPTTHVFRTRQDGDPVAQIQHTDSANQLVLDHPLIGHVTGQMQPASLATELGDPSALGGPIAFTIPKGQRLSASSLQIQLAGAVPSGLSTGEIEIELVADGTGVLTRNRFQSADLPPDNDRSPLLVDLSLDVGIYAQDPTGNATLAGTVLGIQLTGIAIADEGALAIETAGAMDIDLLGLSAAPTNLVLDLISDPNAVAQVDAQAPTLLASLPAADSHDLAPDQGIELVFDEPIDLDQARAGGVVLRDDAGQPVETALELAGSVLVVRPRTPLPSGRAYQVELAHVSDLAGNAMAPDALAVSTPALAQTSAPPALVSVHPGVACALVGATAESAGRCAGGQPNDSGYAPFTLAADAHIDLAFDQPIAPVSVALGMACDTGSVRVEQLTDAGGCASAVPGTLEVRQRELVFVPSAPWQIGQRYRLRVVSGPDARCDAGELCGANGQPARFDPLAGTTTGGGPDLAIDFTITAPVPATTLYAGTCPVTDVNGSGGVDAVESRRETNRVALKIAGTSGIITGAQFQELDCVPQTPETEACMYMLGTMPAQLGEQQMGCTLPDGSTVASCVPVTLAAQTMFATSVKMTADAIGIPITTATGTSVMRVREPASGPLQGFIIDRDGGPVMVVSLDLYMDAPDMTLPIGQHDLHSKQLTVALEGPVVFQPDGRIAIELANTADVPISVGITALGLTGSVNLVVPAGEMKLELMSPPQRGRLP